MFYSWSIHCGSKIDSVERSILVSCYASFVENGWAIENAFELPNVEMNRQRFWPSKFGTPKTVQSEIGPPFIGTLTIGLWEFVRSEFTPSEIGPSKLEHQSLYRLRWANQRLEDHRLDHKNGTAIDWIIRVKTTRLNHHYPKMVLNRKALPCHLLRYSNRDHISRKAPTCVTDFRKLL